MGMNYSIYKNEKSKKRILGHYDEYLHELHTDVEREYVITRFGKTHMLICGPENGKPLFILQGGNCINPMTLSWFSGLLKQYRIFAPDTLGHPGYSDEIRLSAGDESFALWITDLMSHFKINRSAFIGPSYGGGILLRLAAHSPEKIACAILFAPAGIVMGSKVDMIKRILLSLMIYKMNGSKKRLKSITDVLSDGEMKGIDRKIIGEIFRGVSLENDMPKLTTSEDLKHYKAPTMIIGGKKDIFFPGDKLKERAEEVIPNLVEAAICDGGHFTSRQQLESLNTEMSKFLDRYYA